MLARRDVFASSTIRMVERRSAGTESISVSTFSAVTRD
jgi:hypothetical protein